MCDERERLIGYVYDEVDAAERVAIDRHLESCAECRDEIRGLRGVRQDLLAWDVPQRGSVWQPFAPARLRPWWRDVPAWALVAAATIMFAIGAAGGVATRAFMDRPATEAARAAAPPQVMPASISPAELATVRNAIADLRSEMNASARLVSRRPPTLPSVSNRDFEQVRAQLKSGNQRDDELFNVVVGLNNSLARTVTDQNARINSLDQRLRQISDALAAMQASGSGGKQ